MQHCKKMKKKKKNWNCSVVVAQLQVVANWNQCQFFFLLATVVFSDILMMNNYYYNMTRHNGCLGFPCTAASKQLLPWEKSWWCKKPFAHNLKNINTQTLEIKKTQTLEIKSTNPREKKHWETWWWKLICQSTNFWDQRRAFHTAPSPSPHLRWTSLILSTDLQIPLHVQSKDATHTFPACAFHSQSGGVPQHILRSSMWSTSKPMIHDPNETSSLVYLWSKAWLTAMYLARSLEMA